MIFCILNYLPHPGSQADFPTLPTKCILVALFENSLFRIITYFQICTFLLTPSLQHGLQVQEKLKFLTEGRKCLVLMICTDCMTQPIWSEQRPLFSLYLLRCTLAYPVTAYPKAVCLEMWLLPLSLFKVRLICDANNNRTSLCFQYRNAHNLLIPTSVILYQ